MSTLRILIKRNIKLFFKDKGMFFTSLITPMILLVLYVTFLKNVYRDSLLSSLPDGVVIPNRLINGIVGGELVSSLLAVSCVTVAFCSNFLMVQDKVNGAIKDLRVSPVGSYTCSLAYYFANLVSTLSICFVASGICLAYLAVVGWYMSFVDVLLLFADVILLVFFGNALSSVINFFLSSQGQISAIGTIVSSVYGFICGAYMPLSSFSKGLYRIIAFLPGTYGTTLIRNHSMRGAIMEMSNEGVSAQFIKNLMDSVDCNLYFFDKQVSTAASYVVLCLSVVVLLTIYVLLNVGLAKSKNKRRKRNIR